MKLSNGIIEIEYDQNLSSWSFASSTEAEFGFTGASFALSLNQGLDRYEWTGPLENQSTQQTQGVDQRHGAWRGFRVEGSISDFPLSVKIDYRLIVDSGLLSWQLELQNEGHRRINLERIDLLRLGELPGPWLKTWLPFLGPSKAASTISLGGLPPDTWFMDGWQSWSFAGTLHEERVVTGTRLGPITKPMYTNPISPSSRRRNSRVSELFAILGNQDSGKGILVGQLSEQKAFASIQANSGQGSTSLQLTNGLEGIPLDPGEEFTSDWAVVQLVDLHEEEPHRHYLAAVARENYVRENRRSPVGWCSWYYFFDQVNESDIVRNTEWVAKRQPELPIDLIQVDDGYQAEIGDWLAMSDRFPGGHQPLVRQIKESGLMPGLWLAPFIAKPSARIIARHPDWVLRRSDGRPVRAGYNWGTFFIALDLTHPEVMDYVRTVIDTAVNDWGYEYLKLDFLYAAALPGARWDSQQTGAQALRKGIEAIRAAAGEDIFLAGCGCPLGPALGLVDSMRIGPDVAARWLPAYQGIELFFREEPSLPALRNAVQNSLARAPMHDRWWLNDPDCVLMRSSDTHLNADEVRLMATVAALSGGPLIFSDDMPHLDEERVRWAARLLPPLESRAIVPDLFENLRPEIMVVPLDGVIGEWFLLALINWSSARRNLHFNVDKKMALGGKAIGVDFWEEEPVSLEGDRWSLEVPGHGVRLLQLRPVHAGEAVWLGDNLHISGGNVVKRWRVTESGLEADLELGRWGSGKAWIRVPADPKDIQFNQARLNWEFTGDHITMIRLPRFMQGTLHVRW